MVVGLLAAGNSAAAPQTADGETAAPDLAGLPLDQLMNIQVTSVSKRVERLGDTAAAIFVITQEDIRRSGLTALPDILRLAPGVDVAQSDANHWAVSIRGNNGIYSAKLLVLVDGRSIYSPLFSGVFWGVQSVVVQDIARIEVIRGTGGAVWGANAMNGVINIITKPAGETQGLMVAASTGSDLKGELTARYGGQISGNASYRVFVKGFDHDGLVTAAGADAGDAASQINGGFRLDWSPSTADAVSLQGEAYADASHARLLLPTIGSTPTVTPVIERNSGGHGLVNWQHILSETSDVTVQAYFDRTNTEEITNSDGDDTFDIDIRHHFIAARNDIVWGGGYRYISSNTGTSPLVNFARTSVQQRIANVFAQDELTLAPTVSVIAGLRLEDNNFTGLELEPTLRAVWAPSPDQTLWMAVSRAVRTPADVERLIEVVTGALPGNPPLITEAFGNPEQISESMISYEGGYRAEVRSNLNVDVAVYYNRYSDLGAVTPLTPFASSIPLPPHIVIPIQYNNAASGHTYGGEISSSWQVTPAWRLSANYDLMIADVVAGSSAITVIDTNVPGENPRHQLQIRSHLDLPMGFEVDVDAHYVSRLVAIAVPAYTRLDARLGWRATDRIEVGLVGRNLLTDRHLEFAPAYYRAPSEVPRSVRVYVAAAF
jgi:iron complex outermembrane receptor protein